MDFIKKNARTLSVLAAIVAVVAAITLFTGDDNTSDQVSNNTETSEQGNNDTTNEETKPDEAGIVKSEDTSKVTVVEGDNQTVVVRRIIERYASDNKLNLNDAQKLHAETKLVDILGRKDLIHPGEVISLTDAQIKQITDSSAALTADEQALWAQYL